MSDFSAAFEQGQAAAETAALANAEIDDIFSKMASELSDVTGGKLTVSLEDGTRYVSGLMMTIQTITGNPTVGPSEEYWICASNPSAAKSLPVRLAKFVRPYEGYPCQIVYGKSSMRCNDGTALAAALKDMLANAWVAHELRQIMNRPPRQEGEAPPTE